MMKNKFFSRLKRFVIPIYAIFRRKVTGSNNTIVRNSYPNKFKRTVRGNNNVIKFDEDSFLGSITVFIYGSNNKITIADNCTVKSGIFWIEDNNCEIFIDSNTTIESVDFGVSENNSSVYIGKDCMLSSGIKFKTGDSHSIIDADKKNRINPAGNIHVGNHVWIGQEAIILKNTIIGDNSVVGIRAVVTKKFEKNQLLAGMPAKIIKEKINWTRERL